MSHPTSHFDVPTRCVCGSAFLDGNFCLPFACEREMASRRPAAFEAEGPGYSDDEVASDAACEGRARNEIWRER